MLKNCFLLSVSLLDLTVDGTFSVQFSPELQDCFRMGVLDFRKTDDIDDSKLQLNRHIMRQQLLLFMSSCNYIYNVYTSHIFAICNIYDIIFAICNIYDIIFAICNIYDIYYIYLHLLLKKELKT